ncbi:SMP-30/gluconolactonase/LRE family protein [Paenibacillus radicis (ex Gao et al. 2016)]|uniref:Gluconolactonase n=1 Tax=Paenibacillus radicis (ex Gao et al. 2016) TaxID=1737354 RepID=A0A917GPD5_9BACL|nr:SMP-30/gluconolactonase/LRE family protein [Paenibacillus radicis (ex Gao et al. 2016)]GGG53447.1 hypothetical protein GCM10010918_02650 [Paenibacillus radicis (ex Gao et al. 2016)]
MMKLIKLMTSAALLLAAFQLFASPLQAAAPYEGYSYSYWGTTSTTPNAYLPETVINGVEQGIGKFKEPTDLYVDDDGQLYVLDAGNGRIVVFDEQWKVVREIRGFQNGGKQDQFANPQGLFVTKKGQIFVADTDNSRVVELTNEGEFVREIGAPKSEVIRDGFEYFPKKVGVDNAGRIYVIGRGVFDGIIEFDSDGVFTGFMGTNRVKFDVWDYFWKKLSTKAQKSKLAQFVPLEFNNLDLDQEGFIYTTTAEVNSADPIKRLNSTGVDVLRREGYFFPRGDVYSSNPNASSILIDVQVGANGVYSALDSRKGRVFTYNEDGNLMYVFGRIGTQEGTFKTPVAVESRGSQFFVLDQGLNRINVFSPTRYGTLINDANALLVSGDYNGAESKWRELLRLDANNEIAYVGIGKAMLRQGDNKLAMENLKLGYDRVYYSKAFGKYRKEMTRKYFGAGMTVVFVLIAALWSWNIIKRRSTGKVKANVI